MAIKLRCIDNKMLESYLKIGNIYTGTLELSGFYSIDGYGLLRESRFEIVEEDEAIEINCNTCEYTGQNCNCVNYSSWIPEKKINSITEESLIVGNGQIMDIKNITLSDIAREIKKIIGKDQYFKIEFLSNQICFCIYEGEVVISYTSKDNELYIDCGLTDGKIDTQTVNELNQIMNLLEDNKDLLSSFCK